MNMMEGFCMGLGASCSSDGGTWLCSGLLAGPSGALTVGLNTVREEAFAVSFASADLKHSGFGANGGSSDARRSS